jgi:hypothetical protein
MSVGAIAAITVFWLLVAATAVQAASLTGNAACSLEVRSLAADGTELDEGVVQGTSTEGSQEDPFDVDWFGRVDFRFQTGTTVFQNNRWEIYAAGLPVAILKGDDDNPMDLDEIGKVEIADDVPDGTPRIVGLVYVNGWIEGNDGASRCEGSGWVNIVGDPVGTVPWIVMVGLVLTGAVFLVSTPYTGDWEEGVMTPWEGNVPGPPPVGDDGKPFTPPTTGTQGPINPPDVEA